jgi:hypothetical protein
MIEGGMERCYVGCGGWGMNDSLAQLGLLFITQLVLTLYGAGLRRPFGSLRTIADVPVWLRRSRGLVMVLDTVFVVFLVVMWWRLLHVLDLRAFLIGFFVFAAIGALLAHHVNLLKSSAISLAGALLAIYVLFGDGS